MQSDSGSWRSVACCSWSTCFAVNAFQLQSKHMQLRSSVLVTSAANEVNLQSIGSEELHVLIDQLNSSSSDFQQAASTAIAALCCCTASSIVCQRVPEISQMHVNALGPLASLLSSPLVNCQQQALLAIWGICKQDSSGPQELFTSGGMQPLMSFFTFSPDTHACQEQAATILACMCSSSPDAKTAAC